MMRTLWSHTPEVMQLGLLPMLSTSDIHHQESMFEVITSEASFLRSIDTLIDVFFNAPELSGKQNEGSVISRHEHVCIFSNIENVRETSDKFLESLEKRWEENAYITDICDIVIDAVESHFKNAYIPYCRNQMYQERTLQELMKQPEFCQVLENLKQDPQCRFLTLSSFLLLPMQRVTRLPLLLEAVRKNRDASSNYNAWRRADEALNALKNLTKACNEAAKQMERMEAMVRLRTHIHFPSNIKSVPIVKESRHVVREGTVTRYNENGKKTVSGRIRRKPIHLILFTDFLFITKKTRERRPFGAADPETNEEFRYTVIDYCPRPMITCTSGDKDVGELQLMVPTSPSPPANSDCMGKIVLLQNHENKMVEFFVSCETPSEMQRWMLALEPKTKGEEGEDIYESWAAPRFAVKRAHTAKQEDELTLREGEVVEVQKKMADGWYEGLRISDSTVGWFPGHCVEELPGSDHKRAKHLKQKYQLLKAAEQILVKKSK